MASGTSVVEASVERLGLVGILRSSSSMGCEEGDGDEAEAGSVCSVGTSSVVVGCFAEFSVVLRDVAEDLESVEGFLIGPGAAAVVVVAAGPAPNPPKPIIGLPPDPANLAILSLMSLFLSISFSSSVNSLSSVPSPPAPSPASWVSSVTSPVGAEDGAGAGAGGAGGMDDSVVGEARASSVVTGTGVAAAWDGLSSEIWTVVGRVSSDGVGAVGSEEAIEEG